MRKALKERELGSSFALALHLFDPEFQKLLNLRVMRCQDLQGALKVSNRARFNVFGCVSVFGVALYACDEVFC
jgi:hypothetical protein